MVDTILSVHRTIYSLCNSTHRRNTESRLQLREDSAELRAFPPKLIYAQLKRNYCHCSKADP